MCKNMHWNILELYNLSSIFDVLTGVGVMAGVGWTFRAAIHKTTTRNAQRTKMIMKIKTRRYTQSFK